MRYRIGKCPVCGRRVAIYMSRFVKPTPESLGVTRKEPSVVIASHQSAIEGLPTDPSVQIAGVANCAGWSMEPAPDPQLDNARRKREAKQRTKFERLVAPFRDHARVALDATIDNKPYPVRELAVLLTVAFHDYAAWYGKKTPIVAIVKFVGVVDHKGARLRVGDIYCSFCGMLLHRSVKTSRHGRIEPERLHRVAAYDTHAIRCALEHLAFGLEPAEPGARRLPDEYRADAEATA